MKTNSETGIVSRPELQTAEAPGPSSFRGQRALDCCLATLAIILTSPLILLNTLWSLASEGRLLARANDGVSSGNARRFAGSAPGAGLAALFDVIAGHCTLASPPRTAARPGLFTAAKLRKNLGVEFLEAEQHGAATCGWGPGAYFAVLGRSLIASIMSPARPPANERDFHLFGVPVVNARMADALDDMLQSLQAGRQTSVGFVNADCLNRAFNHGDYHHALNQFDRIYPDGIGVRLAAQMFGVGIRENVNGTDLFPVLCERLAESGHSIYLLGAREGIARAAATTMQSRYPGLEFAGCHHGYFDTEEEDAVIEAINRSGADVLLVAMGAPGQELWIDRNRSRLNARLQIGVGGLFDFYSGRIARAPVWLREIGLEWVWRLLQEPGRMWRRYIVGNPLFLYRAWSEKRRHGATVRAGRLTPSEESRVLEHYGGLDRAVSLRQGLVRLRHMAARLPAMATTVLKRTLDVVAAVILLALLSPLFLTVILLIRLESPGPAFFSQMRVGYRGQMFRLWKFRSMYLDAETRRADLEVSNEMQGGVIFKMKKDPRITRVGQFIRKTSIDELPQLWNVLKGDMSLVGPRPALASEVELYSIEERVRLLAKPGITCIWQVSGRSDIPFPRQVLLDEDYLYRQSLTTDLKLLLQTVPAVLLRKGAY